MPARATEEEEHMSKYKTAVFGAAYALIIAGLAVIAALA